MLYQDHANNMTQKTDTRLKKTLPFKNVKISCHHLNVYNNNKNYDHTWCLGLPTMEGKTARGASSPAKPALHIPEPLSTTRAAISSSMAVKQIKRLNCCWSSLWEAKLHMQLLQLPCRRRKGAELKPSDLRQRKWSGRLTIALYGNKFQQLNAADAARGF